MFFIYCFILFAFVYFLPALAAYPKLLLSSKTVVIAPLLSIAIVFTLQLVLETLGVFTHQNVVIVSLLIGIIALCRIFLLYKNNNDFDWCKSHKYLISMCAFIALYFVVIQSSKGFDTDDEIYSWNMWAVQHYLSLPIDLYYTRSPYPQLFPRLIAYCYKLLGNADLQIPVKTLFAIFPFCVSACISLISPKISFANTFRSAILVLLTIVLLTKNFSTGLADPLMATSLVAAVYLYILYIQEPKRYELFVLCIICSAVAVLTKQAAIIWALFSLPIMVILNIKNNKLPFKSIYGILLLIAIVVFWMFTEGHQFINNTGVVTASKGSRGLMEQLWYGVKFQSKRPLVPLLVLVGTASILLARKYLTILWLFLVPALIAWLEFGSYSDVRLGMHIIAILALLIVATEFPIKSIFGEENLPKIESYVLKYKKLLIAIFLVLISTMAISKRYNSLKVYNGGFSVNAGGKNTIYKYFSKDAAFVYDNLYNKSDLLLWIPSNYIYGVFYAHTPIIRPNDYATQYSLGMLLTEIIQNKPDYLFDSGDFVGTPASALLRELAEHQCPDLFKKVVSVVQPTKYNYTIYKLNKDDRLLSQCKAHFV